MKYPAISVWQLWASALAHSVKHFETRSWVPRDNYRGPMLIHASKTWDIGLRDFFLRAPFVAAFAAAGINVHEPPLGCLLGVGELTHVYRTDDARLDQSELEIALGDWSDGRFCWQFERVRLFPEPIPMRGQQGIFMVELELP